MPIPTSTQTAYGTAPILALSTAADTIAYAFPCQTIRWVFTTGITSASAIQITQSTAVQPTGTTYGWPLVGTSTASVFAGLAGSTVSLAPGGYVDYPINQWVYGLTLVAISAGHIEVIKASPNLDWVIKGRQTINTTALA